MVDPGDPCRPVGPLTGALLGGEDHGDTAVGDRRAVVDVQRVERRRGGEQLVDRRGAPQLGVGVVGRVGAAAVRDRGHLLGGDGARVEHGACLEAGERDRVRPERPVVVGVQLAGHHPGQVARRRLRVAVDQRRVGVAGLDLQPRLVQRPRAVHLDVALLDRRPRPDRVERHHEAERLPGEVVGAARAGEADLGDAPHTVEHLVDDRLDHLDLVELGRRPTMVGLCGRDDGDPDASAAITCVPSAARRARRARRSVASSGCSPSRW